MGFTYIDDLRFEALVQALKKIVIERDPEADDPLLDDAVTDALTDIGKITPASWREIHERESA